jgi:hypothetical protein
MELLALFLHAHFGGNRYTYKLSWGRELYMAPSCLSRDPILPSLRGMSLYTELLKCICLYICSKKIHMACCHLEDYFVVTCSNLLSLSLFGLRQGEKESYQARCQKHYKACNICCLGGSVK